jgi:hypothetical protein
MKKGGINSHSNLSINADNKQNGLSQEEASKRLEQFGKNE